ncbi:IS1096 element passenger TnpR family protein [Variovorax guangxiensis]
MLQVAFGWQDMHLHRFEIRGREYGTHQRAARSSIPTLTRL